MILAVLSFFCAQSVDGQDSLFPGNPPPRERILVDRVMGTVHDRIITESDWRTLSRRNPPPDGLTLEEQDRYRRKLLDDRIDEILQTQAASDMLDRKAIENISDYYFDRYVESRGGRIPTSEALREQGGTPGQLKEEIEEDILRRSWREATTGKSPGPSGRISADRFVRPGQIYALYNLESETPRPEWIELLGGEHERAVLQTMILPVDAQGTTAALLRGKELAQRARDGEDFTLLVRANSVVFENDGIQQPYPLHAIAAMSKEIHGDDELERFARQAAVGDISLPILTGEASTRRPAVHIYRLIERLPAQVPDFVDETTQKALVEEIQRLNDDRRIARAMTELRRASINQANRDLRGRSKEVEAEPGNAPGP
jgi:hypothetical protein